MKKSVIILILSITLLFCGCQNNADSETQKEEEAGIEVQEGQRENYAFTDVAYLIEPEAKREQEVDWEWLHGPLPPGEYRIKKTVHDFRGTGDFDEYTLYARFVLN